MAETEPTASSAAPAQSLSGAPPKPPKGGIPKKMLYAVLGGLLVLIVGAKLARDIYSGELTQEVKQADRQPGESGDKQRVKGVIAESRPESVRSDALTQEQLARAAAMPAGLSAAEAAANVRQQDATSPNQARPGATVAAPLTGESLRTTSVDKGNATPESLVRRSLTAAGVASAGPAATPNAPPKDARFVRGKSDPEVTKAEEILFSARTSPLAVGGISTSVSAARSVERLPEPQRRDASAGSPGGGSAIETLVDKYQNLVTAKQPASAQGDSRNSDWLKGQQAQPALQPVFSAAAIPGAVILPGSIINAVTRTVIRSDLPGDFIGLVTEDVYDSVKSTVIVIPKGSRLSGSASSDLRVGQERALTAIKSVYFPDGRSFDLQGSPGSDQEGAAGFQDEVDHHYFRKYGAGLLLAAIAYAVDRVNPSNQVAVLSGVASQQKQTLSDYAGQTVAETTRSYIDQQKQVSETLIIRAGYPFTIIVRRPLVLIPTNARLQ